VAILLEGVAPALLGGSVNALRLSLHPDGMARRIVNLGAWRRHVLRRLQEQFSASGDEQLRSLAAELAMYPAPSESPDQSHLAEDDAGVAVPLLIDSSVGRLAFLTTTTVFGTPVDITLAELALETFFPADEATASALRLAAASRAEPQHI
jgi:hypothetical protein